MTRDEVFPLVRDAVATAVGIDADAVTPATPLDADRLACVEIAAILGSLLPVEVDDRDLRGLATVGQVVDYVLGRR